MTRLDAAPKVGRTVAPGVAPGVGAGVAKRETENPLLQAVRIGFVALRIATLVLAIAWAFGNVREIGPGTQAVIFRFGAVVRVAQAGLVAAWPRPFERVEILPSGERQMTLAIEGAPPAPPQAEDTETATWVDVGTAAVAPQAATYLTGDGEVLRLDARVTWRITDAAAYVVARDHVQAALRRLFLAASLDTAARHELDDLLSVRPERANDPAAQDARARMRLVLVDAVNARLAALARDGAPLGVALTRADLTPLLPDAAKPSFDAVLDAAQRADEALATERTQAELTRQQADRDRDRALTDAHAAASERIAHAESAVATITALESRMDTVSRPALLREIYLTRVGAVLRAAGHVDTVPAGGDPAHAPHILIPGPHP